MYENKSKIIFKQVRSNGDVVKLVLNGDSTTTELCEAFGDFLRGCSFIFDGEIEIVDQNNHTGSDLDSINDEPEPVTPPFEWVEIKKKKKKKSKKGKHK